jgi:hypothetical protein
MNLEKAQYLLDLAVKWKEVQYMFRRQVELNYASFDAFTAGYVSSRGLVGCDAV